MVWQKFRTLNSTYNVEDLQTGYSATQSRTWLYEQIADLREVLNGRGWANQVDSGATNSTDYRNEQWASPLLTDLWTGAQKRYRYYIEYSYYQFFGNSTRSPYRVNFNEDRNYDGSSGFTSFHNVEGAKAYGGMDGGDYFATGKIQYWESTENPQAVLVTTGGGYPVFYWPGMSNVYFYEANVTDDYRWQNTIFPATSNQFTSHTGNPQNNYGSVSAQILPQRMSNGSGTIQDMPGAESVVYTDFWYFNTSNSQPLFASPTTDVVYYAKAPYGGGYPTLTSRTDDNYKSYYKLESVTYNNEYYGSWRNFWFNFGSTPPDFGSDYAGGGGGGGLDGPV